TPPAPTREDRCEHRGRRGGTLAMAGGRHADETRRRRRVAHRGKEEVRPEALIRVLDVGTEVQRQRRVLRARSSIAEEPAPAPPFAVPAAVAVSVPVSVAA